MGQFGVGPGLREAPGLSCLRGFVKVDFAISSSSIIWGPFRRLNRLFWPVEMITICPAGLVGDDEWLETENMVSQLLKYATSKQTVVLYSARERELGVLGRFHFTLSPTLAMLEEVSADFAVLS